MTEVRVAIGIIVFALVIQSVVALVRLDEQLKDSINIGVGLIFIGSLVLLAAKSWVKRSEPK